MIMGKAAGNGNANHSSHLTLVGHDQVRADEKDHKRVMGFKCSL